MDSGSWIAIYLPILIVIIGYMQQNEYRKIMIIRHKKRRGLFSMTNELLSKHIGKKCKISTGSYGSNVTGRILEIKDDSGVNTRFCEYLCRMSLTSCILKAHFVPSIHQIT